MKKITISVIIIIVLIILSFYFFGGSSKTVIDENPVPTPSITQTTVSSSTSAVVPSINKNISVIGKSAGGLDINAYHYGTGTKEILFVGGIHGGYEWNTVLTAYNLMDYLKANPDVVPTNLKITVIPVLNPDGLFKVVNTTDRFTKADVSDATEIVVAGRFNSNNVDLNRNFDCDWQTSGKWQNKTVSGGTSAFSEPESQAMKTYVEANKPAAAIVWYSAAGGVYSSNCHGGILPETTVLTNLYAKASGYSANDSFDFYATTGDMVNWLAKNSIPAISVILTSHDSAEWSKNQAGIKAILGYYAK